MKKKLIILLISNMFIIIFLSLISYCISFILQNIYIYENILSNPSIIFKDFKIYNFFYILNYKLINNQIMLLIIIFFNIYILYNLLKKITYKNAEEYGSHGTSNFYSDKEIKKLFNDSLGWIYGARNKKDYVLKNTGSEVYKNINDGLNMQTLVFGTPGSNKTTGLILPNIFHIPKVYKEKKLLMPDIVLTDTKGEIYKLTANYLKDEGYEIKVLDFKNLKKGESINIFDYIKNEVEMIEVITSFSTMIAAGEDDSDFWQEQATSLLGAIASLHIKINNKVTFADIINFTKHLSDIEYVNNLFIHYKVDGVGLDLWNNIYAFKDSSNTTSGVIATLTSKLKLFATEEVKDFTSKTTFDISKLKMKKEKPIALYIMISDSSKTFFPIANLVINLIFREIYKSDDYTGSIYMLLDEMASLGYIKDIEIKLSNMRSRKIYPMMIFQSISQMKARYKHTYEDILSQCDNLILLGANDEFTCKYFSSIVGKTTIKISNQGGYKEKTTENNSYIQRALILDDEIRRMDNKKMLVVQRTHYPYMIYKIQYKYWKNSICKISNIEDIKDIEKRYIKKINFINFEKNNKKDTYEENIKIENINLNELI